MRIALRILQETFDEVYDFAFGYDIIRTCEDELEELVREDLKAMPNLQSRNIRTSSIWQTITSLVNGLYWTKQMLNSSIACLFANKEDQPPDLVSR